MRDIAVDGSHQLQHRIFANLRLLAFECADSGALDDRNVIARELIAGQQITDFQFDEFDQFRVGQIHLVEEHNKRRHANLTCEQDMLARLRHRPVRRRNHQDRAVHLRCTRYHIFYVIGVTRAVDVGVMTIGRLVFDMRRGDCNAARPLLRCLVNLVVRRERRTTRLCQHLGDRCRQRRLSVVNMTYGANVAMRLVALEFRLCHRRLSVTLLSG